MRKSENEPGEIQSIKRAFRLVEVLSQEPEMALTELSNLIAVNKAMTYRLLYTLKVLGYVEQNPENEKYRLNLKLFQVGSSVVSRIDVIKEARPVISALAEETEETVYLGIRDRIHVIYVDKVDSKHALRMFSTIGERKPAWCSSIGKALLAWLPEKDIDDLLDGTKMEKTTPNSIDNMEELKKDLKETVARGYAFDNEESWRGLYCCGAPVFDRKGNVAAAVSISWPTIRNTKESARKYQKLVSEAGKEISRRLGHNPQ